MKAEGITAIQQIQNIQQDPEIYHLSKNSTMRGWGILFKKLITFKRGKRGAFSFRNKRKAQTGTLDQTIDELDKL